MRNKLVTITKTKFSMKGLLMKKILINSGLLLLMLPSGTIAADKKAAAAKITVAAAGTQYLQPPATPRLQSLLAAMPPATPASAAATTASTNSSPSTTAASAQQVQVVAKVAAASPQPAEEWEACNTPRLGNYLANKNNNRHITKKKAHGRGSITSMNFGNTWFDGNGNEFTMMGHSVTNPPKPPVKRLTNAATQQPKPTPAISSSAFCCGSSDDVLPFESA